MALSDLTDADKKVLNLDIRRPCLLNLNHLYDEHHETLEELEITHMAHNLTSELSGG